MGITLTDVLLFGKAQSDDVDNATFVIYRRNILRWSALGGYLDIIVKGVAPLSLPDAIANSLSYVKAFGGTEQRNLPDNYIERQYIYMMDGSYLTTDIVPTSDMRIEMDFQTLGLGSGGCAWLGARDGSAGSGIAAGYTGSNALFFDGFTGTRYLPTTSAVANKRYKYTWNNGAAALTSGGTTVISNTFTPTGTTTNYLTINAMTSSGSVILNSAGIYLYSFKVWNGQGELVMDLVPAVQKGTVPVVGFYDTVSKTFMTATAGTFAAGAEAVPTPDAPMGIVSNNGVLKVLESATGITTQAGTPTPANPVPLVSYHKGSLILRSVGEYADSYDATTKEITRRVGVKLLDGTEEYKLYGSGAELRASTEIAGKHAAQTGVSSLMCSHFAAVADATAGGVIGGQINCDSNPSYPTTIRIGINGLVTTAEQFTQWVADQYAAGTPVTVYYPLATETTETVDSIIYTDGITETINVHSKNLFDKSTVSIVAPGTSRSDFIRVVPGVVYSMSAREASVIIEYDSEQTQLQTLYVGTSTYTPSADAVFAQFNVMNTYLDTFQIERGSTATAYQPYFDSGTATAEMLLKISSDYQDQQEIIDGTVTRKIGVKVLDGTESWTVASTNVLQADVFPVSSAQPAVGGYCTTLSYTDSSTLSGMPENSFRLGSQVYPRRLYVKSSVYATDATTWTNYLTAQYAAGTPVMVVYPLAEPTTESVTGQTLQVTAGDNTLEITQASLNNLELEAKYQAAVSLTIQEVQDANLDPNVEVTIN